MASVLGRHLPAMVRISPRALRRSVEILGAAVLAMGTCHAEDNALCVETPISDLYGTYVYAEMFRYKPSVIFADKLEDLEHRAFAQAHLGHKILIGPDRFQVGEDPSDDLHDMIIDPVYEVSCYPFIEGNVPAYKGTNFFGAPGVERSFGDPESSTYVLYVHRLEDAVKRIEYAFEVPGETLWELTGRWVLVLERAEVE